MYTIIVTFKFERKELEKRIARNNKIDFLFFLYSMFSFVSCFYLTC